MKVSDIDKQIVDLINFMNEKEMKPFASCDGVLEEHEEEYRNIYGENFDSFLNDRPEMILCGYISFMENDHVKEILANALDNDLIIEFATVSNDYKIYGNLITGKTYTIRFLNLNGEKTDLVNKVIKETYENVMIPSEKNLKLVQDIMESIPNEVVNYKVVISLNSIKNFNMKKDDYGKHATILVINGNGYEIDGNEFSEFFSNEFGIKLYTNDDNKNEVLPDRSYVLYQSNLKSRSTLILRDEFINKIPAMLKKMFEHKFTLIKK